MSKKGKMSAAAKENLKHKKKMHRAQEKRYRTQTKLMKQNNGLKGLTKDDRAKIMKKRENRQMVRESMPYLATTLTANTANIVKETESNKTTGLNWNNLVTNGVVSTQDDASSITNTGSVLGG